MDPIHEKIRQLIEIIEFSKAIQERLSAYGLMDRAGPDEDAVRVLVSVCTLVSSEGTGSLSGMGTHPGWQELVDAGSAAADGDGFLRSFLAQQDTGHRKGRGKGRRKSAGSDALDALATFMTSHLGEHPGAEEILAPALSDTMGFVYYGRRRRLGLPAWVAWLVSRLLEDAHEPESVTHVRPGTGTHIAMMPSGTRMTVEDTKAVDPKVRALLHCLAMRNGISMVEADLLTERAPWRRTSSVVAVFHEGDGWAPDILGEAFSMEYPLPESDEGAVALMAMAALRQRGRKGRSVILMPNSHLFGGSTGALKVRRMLVEDGMVRVLIGLPSPFDSGISIVPGARYTPGNSEYTLVVLGDAGQGDGSIVVMDAAAMHFRDSSSGVSPMERLLDYALRMTALHEDVFPVHGGVVRVPVADFRRRAYAMVPAIYMDGTDSLPKLRARVESAYGIMQYRRTRTDRLAGMLGNDELSGD